MNKKRIVLATAFAALVVALLIAAIYLRPHSGEMMLVNEAYESIVKGTVKLGDEKFEFEKIMPGESRRILFRSGGNPHYSVSVEFHYERKLEVVEGYFNPGAKTHQRLIIKNDEIYIESGAD